MLLNEINILWVVILQLKSIAVWPNHCCMRHTPVWCLNAVSVCDGCMSCLTKSSCLAHLNCTSCVSQLQPMISLHFQAILISHAVMHWAGVFGKMSRCKVQFACGSSCTFIILGRHWEHTIAMVSKHEVTWNMQNFQPAHTHEINTAQK